jgi:hypothetical protein
MEYTKIIFEDDIYWVSGDIVLTDSEYNNLKGQI